MSASVSHYTIFQRYLGFRWLKGNSYVYEVEGVSGKVFTIELESGSLTEKPAEPSARGDAENRAPQPRRQADKRR
ncbi:MAG: hypothetical protein LAO31_09900 [Acidobacteriia bacterium]|nr:hypothetical protein [Terriglobia bacterium]